MVYHPDRFRSIVSVLHTCGVVDKGLLKFAEFQMNSEEKRTKGIPLVGRLPPAAG